MNVKLAQNIYQSPLLKKGLKFASENSAIFTAGATLALSSVARPISVMLTPSTDKEDKKISAINSISSSLAGFLFMLLFSLPLAKGVKKIDAEPEKYLSQKTIENLKDGAQNLLEAKPYQLVTQIFKLGLGFLLAYPKAIVKNTLTPKIANLTSKKDDEKNNEPSFKGSEKFISKIINNQTVQQGAKKLQNGNFLTGMICLSDIFSTLAFVDLTRKNKNLDEHKKKVLNYNSIISTALCIVSGLALDKLLDKPTEKFISKLKEYNPNLKDFSKYAEGAKIAKTTAVFGAVYYCIIPLISTFLSSKIAKDDKPSGGFSQK